jgi:hypothetical protein
MSLVVGILGFKGSGKDAVGDFITQYYGFERVSFADTLKDAVSAVFGWERELLEGTTAESRLWRETPDEWWEEKLNWKEHEGRYLNQRFTPRVALQYWGTDLLRKHFHDDIWILSLANKIRQKDRVVITDCRFPNEFKMIKDAQGFAARVQRGPEPAWFNDGLIACDGSVPHKEKLVQLGIHESEYAWLGLPFDEIIVNNGTLRDLEATTKCWMTKIL